jgi:hypothetical protein
LGHSAENFAATGIDSLLLRQLAQDIAGTEQDLSIVVHFE